MKIWIGAVLAALASAPICCASADAAAKVDSVTYQIDVAHDGAITFSGGFSAPLRQAWIRNLGGPVSYPVTYNGIVFVTVGNTAGQAGTQLYALNLQTGATIWQKSVNSSDDFSNVAIDKGTLFWLDSGGLLQAITADEHGKQKWAKQIGDWSSVEAPPVASGGLIYNAGIISFLLAAVSEKNGAIKWQQAVEWGQDSLPAVGDNGVYVSYPGQYYKFNLTKGKSSWHYNDDGINGGGGATPVVFGNNVYIRDWATGDWILDAATGEKIGSFDSEEAPAFWSDSQGNSYQLALANRTLSEINLSTGATEWSFTGDGGLTCAPIVINNVVVAGSSLGNLYILDAASGSQLWTTNLGAAIAQGEQPGIPWSGLGAGENTLLVPASNLLAAYVPQ
ncbi:MAG: PQQ-binding-like beta-propeller repeat protein [Rhizomicrobium sp.]